MKKILFVLMVLLTVSNADAQRRHKKKRKSQRGGRRGSQTEQVIKTNPLGFIFNSYSIGYERKTKESQSFQIDLNYTDFDFEVLEISGLGAGASYRFYFKEQDDFEGYFVSPTIGYSSLKFTDNSFGSSEELKVGIFTLGTVGGYQWNWSNFTLELFAGPIYANISGEDSDSYKASETGITFTGGFSIGYAF